MHRSHGIIAPGWMIDAARKGSLSLVLTPLTPEPWTEENRWVWPSHPVDLFWFKSEGVGSRLLNKLGYQVGDRIYLKEECATVYGNIVRRSDYQDSARVSPKWLAAEEMPMSASRHWYTIKEIKVCKLQELTTEELYASGLNREPLKQGCKSDDIWDSVNEASNTWDLGFPDYPFGPDRFVVALSASMVR